MLSVKNLVKIYKIGKTKETVKALNNVSIDFPEKGLVFLLGKSGSGKSTLLNAIGGLDTFDSGEIIIKGKSSKDFNQSDFDSYRNTFIGFIFQEYNVLEEFTVAKNLSIALELQGKHADKKEVDKLLEQVDMLEYAKRKPNQLSGGQKQRVAIARALIKNPEIIMADEPTGALDSNTGKQVMETLKKLSQEKLVIIVSHDREFAEIYGDRIIELKDGKIIQDITKKEVESTKTQSGVSLIEDSIIHIKQGTQLTQEDIIKINNVLVSKSANSDVIISIDEKANEQVKKANFITDNGNKETFIKTTEEDVVLKDYNSKDFKLIKSKLKYKDSFKMGASALKNKVAKLVFTIFLSFIAFAMFGIIDTLSSFNRASGVYNTIKMANTQYVSIKKEQKGEYSNNNSPFKQSDLDYIKQHYPEIDIEVIANRGIRFGESYINENQINIGDLTSYSSNPVYNANYSGIISINQEKLEKLGFTLVSGRLPQNNNEVCISEHTYNCFKKNNDDKINSPEEFLQKYSNCNLYNNNGYTLNCKIVGIIRSNEDISKYTNLTTEEINSNFTMRDEISTVFGFGYNTMIYATEEKYNELVAKPINISLAVTTGDNSSWSTVSVGSDLNKLSNYEDLYYQDYMFQQFNDRFYLKNNQSAITSINSVFELANDEILVPSSTYEQVLSQYLNANDLEDTNTNREYALNNGLLKVYLRDTEEPTGPIIKTLKIAGYLNYDYDFYSNSTLKNELLTEPKTYYIYKNQTDNNCGLFNDLYQIKNNFIQSWPLSFDLQAYRNETEMPDYKNITLTGNEAIVSSSYLYNLGTEDELKEKIANGTLSISIKSGSYNNSPVLSEIKVIGIINDYNKILVSDKLYNEKFKSLTEGYEYIIATMSDNEKVNEEFIKFCETYHNDFVMPIQISSTPILDNFSEIFNTLTEVFFWMGIGFAVFAALLLMNFISTSISYKKREIGILRALGARGSDVFGIFFNESLVIALINFALATTTTIVTCGILNNIIVKKLGLNLVLLSVGIRQIALMLGISILTAFIASLLPVFKIAKKKPIDAINNR